MKTKKVVVPAACRAMTRTAPAAKEKQQLVEDQSVAKAPKESIDKFVGLGGNCHTARWLHTLEWRKAACPFDKHFSYPAMIAEAVNDGFRNYLDVTQCRSVKGKQGGFRFEQISL